MNDAEPYDLAGQVIGCAMQVHREPGPGFLESVHQDAPALEPADQGLPFAQSVKTRVLCRTRHVGNFFADMAVGGRDTIVEHKAVESLLKIHEVRLVNILTATGIPHGLPLRSAPVPCDSARNTSPDKPPPATPHNCNPDHDPA